MDHWKLLKLDESFLNLKNGMTRASLQEFESLLSSLGSGQTFPFPSVERKEITVFRPLLKISLSPGV